MIFSVVGWWLKPGIRREEQKASWRVVMDQHIFIFPLAFDPSSGSQLCSGRVRDDLGLAGQSARWVMSFAEIEPQIKTSSSHTRHEKKQ